jgi:enhancing lycopene biosynthesis protein 2
MAGKYGPASVTVTLEDGPGGTARNLQNFTLEGISVKTTSLTADTTALGDSFEEHTPIGVRRVEPITLTLIWDTTGTTGTHAVLNAVDDGPQDDTRELVVVFGDSKTFTVGTRLTSYEVIAQNGNIQTCVAELLPTGAGVWS